MHRMSWTLYFWPGLPQVCRRGSWAGLALALLVALVLNAALVATFGWTELVSPALRNGLWLVFGIVWLLSALYSVGGGSSGRDPAASAADDASFGEALVYYLKGNWFQAERLLSHALARNDHDHECRLMLATLYRHRGRLQEAAAQLDTLERQEGAQKWGWEICCERQLLAQQEDKAAAPISPDSSAPQAA